MSLLTSGSAKVFIIFLLNITINAALGDSSKNAIPQTNYSMKTYTFKQTKVLDLKVDIYRPAGAGRSAVIMWIHGGALILGGRASLPPQTQFQEYLNAGYVLASIDYRLAPETKLKEIVEDVEDAYAWIRTEGPGLFDIDPERIAVMGMSAGGYLTLTSGFRLNPRPRALVSLYGYGDITGPWYSQPNDFYRTSQPIVSKEKAFEAVSGGALANTGALSSDDSESRGYFYLYCRQNGLWPDLVSGHDLSKEPKWFDAYEPRKNVTVDYPPTMLLHGKKDTDVNFEQSVLMAEQLKRKGVEYYLISQAHWGHGFDYDEEDQTVKNAHKEIIRFLEKHL